MDGFELRVGDAGLVGGTALAPGDYLVVSVSDDGSGMTPEIQRHLFTPMFTTKGERGTGLGLASAHSTISRHQGAIEVESWPGKGTRFRIALPLAATAP